MHPIYLFRRRCYFCAGSHANWLEQTTHLPLLDAFFSQFLNGWSLPKSLINNDAHNRPFCTSARLQPISEYSWLHTIHFYIPHQASSYILAIRSLCNSKRLSRESIRCCFRFVAQLSRPQSHTPYDTFHNHTLHYYFRKSPPPFEEPVHSIDQLQSDSIDYTLSCRKISPCWVIPYNLLIRCFIYSILVPAIRLYTTIIENTPPHCANPYIPSISYNLVL